MPRRSWAGAGFGILVGLALTLGTAAAAPEPVVVTVLSPNRKPLSGFHVSVLAERNGGPVFKNPTRLAGGITNVIGTVRLPGLDPATRVTLVVTPPDARWRDYADHCETGWQPATTSMKVREARALHGVVQDSEGRPVAHALVRAEVPPLKTATVSGVDGTFAFENLPPGSASLHAEYLQKKGGVLRSAELNVETHAQGVTLAFEKPAGETFPAMRVRIVTPNGRPVAHGHGYFHSKTTNRSRRGTSTSFKSLPGAIVAGVATARDVRGRLWLAVAGARTEFGEPLPFGPARGGPYGPGPVDEKLELPEERVISGTVRGPDGQPRAGVRVEAVPVGQDRWSNLRTGGPRGISDGEGISDAEGRFRVGGLGQGRYDVRALPTPDYVAGGDVRVPAGAGEVEVRVLPAAKPRFTVKDPKGRPLEGALVRVLDPRRLEHFGESNLADEQRTDASGAARLAGLDPEVEYVLEVRPPKARSDLLRQEFSAWQPADMDVTLQRGRLIAGTVHDQGGRPVPWARLVWAHVPEAVGERVRPLTFEAGADGSFTLKDLRTGSYRIWVRPPLEKPKKAVGAQPARASEPKDIEPTTVASGSEDIVIVLRMPASLTFKVRGWMKKVLPVKALLVAEGTQGRIEPLAKKLGKDGTVVFDGLQWDVTYAFWIGVPKEDACFYAPGLVVDNGRHDYTLQQGHAVKGRVVSPKGTRSRKVWAAYPGFEVKGKLRSGGQFEIKGLPPGPWTIRASGKQGKTMLSGETQAKAGEEAVVTLAP